MNRTFFYIKRLRNNLALKAWAVAGIIGLAIIVALVVGVYADVSVNGWGNERPPSDYPRNDVTVTTTQRDGTVKTIGGKQFDPSEGKEFYLADQIAQRNYDSDRIAALIHDQVNALRKTKVVQPLEYDDRLEAIALKHSMDMSERDFFSHDNPDGQGPTERAEASDYDCRKTLADGSMLIGIGENIMTSWAYESYKKHSFGTDVSYDWRTNQEIAANIFNGWYSSTGHLLNMYTASYDREGIGIYIDDYGRVFATQNFC